VGTSATRNIITNQHNEIYSETTIKNRERARVSERRAVAIECVIVMGRQRVIMAEVEKGRQLECGQISRVLMIVIQRK
jgi:hypothetical protein